MLLDSLSWRITMWILGAMLVWGTWRARCRRVGRHRSRFGEGAGHTIRAVRLRDFVWAEPESEIEWAARMGVRLPSYR